MKPERGRILAALREPLDTDVVASLWPRVQRWAKN